MKHVAVLVLLPLLAACGGGSNDGNSDHVSIHADENGQVSFNFPFANGNVKMPTSMMRDGHTDIDGVDLMPGSSITGFNLDAAHKTANMTMTFKSPAPPDQVRSYFIDQFRKQGVKASINGDSVTGKSKEGTPFTIQVAAAPGGSQGTLVIHSNDD